MIQVREPAGSRMNPARRRITRPSMVAVVSLFLAGGIDPGTAESPELRDAQGDVAYPDGYAGPRDPDYLDVVAAWIEFTPLADTFDVVIQVVDLPGNWTDRDEFAINCNLNAVGIVDGRPYSNVAFWALKMDRDPQVESTADITIQSTGASSAVRHEFFLNTGQPGSIAWSGIPRQDLLDAGHALEDFAVSCSENYRPGTSQVSLGGGRDQASSSTSVDLLAFEPRNPTDGGDEEIPSGSGGPDGQASATPDFSATAVLAAAVVAVAAKRRGHRQT